METHALLAPLVWLPVNVARPSPVHNDALRPGIPGLKPHLIVTHGAKLHGSQLRPSTDSHSEHGEGQGITTVEAGTSSEGPRPAG